MHFELAVSNALLQEASQKFLAMPQTFLDHGAAELEICLKKLMAACCAVDDVGGRAVLRHERCENSFCCRAFLRGGGFSKTPRVRVKLLQASNKQVLLPLPIEVDRGAGVASLIGVIVSHVIVLFDFIEEMHEKGEPLERALPDAGIERIRPVMITVGATILALFPLALEGGPLWKPLCYAQIGGLAVATFITLLLVPVFYAIFVLDLKWIKLETTENQQ